jgi:hypothetical protein
MSMTKQRTKKRRATPTNRQNALAWKAAFAARWEATQRAYVQLGMDKNPEHAALFRAAEQNIRRILKILEAEAIHGDAPRTKQ